MLKYLCFQLMQSVAKKAITVKMLKHFRCWRCVNMYFMQYVFEMTHHFKLPSNPNFIQKQNVGTAMPLFCDTHYRLIFNENTFVFTKKA